MDGTNMKLRRGLDRLVAGLWTAMLVATVLLAFGVAATARNGVQHGVTYAGTSDYAAGSAAGQTVASTANSWGP